MISEILTPTIVLPQKDSSIYQSIEPEIQKSELTFEPQEYVIIERGNEAFLKFYGPLSSGMEYFFEREKAHIESMKGIKKGTNNEAGNITSFQL